MTPIAKNLMSLIAKDNTSHIHPSCINLFSHYKNKVNIWKCMICLKNKQQTPKDII